MDFIVVVGAGGGGERNCAWEGNASRSAGDLPVLAACTERPPKEQSTIIISIASPQAQA